MGRVASLPMRGAWDRKGKGRGWLRVVAEGDGLALAGVGGLGPVSSTGDRRGRERVPE